MLVSRHKTCRGLCNSCQQTVRMAAFKRLTAPAAPYGSIFDLAQASDLQIELLNVFSFSAQHASCIASRELSSKYGESCLCGICCVTSLGCTLIEITISAAGVPERNRQLVVSVTNRYDMLCPAGKSKMKVIAPVC